MANSGFFVANLFSFFHPGPLAVTTPPELLSYGWTTADAPVYNQPQAERAFEKLTELFASTLK